MKKFFRVLGQGFAKYQYHITCTAITLLLLLLWVFCFPNALGRFVEAFRDFGISIAHVFCDTFSIEMDFSITVNELPDYSFLNPKTWFDNAYAPKYPTLWIPLEWEEFTEKWKVYWQAFIDKRNFLMYLYYLVNILYWVVTISMYAVPLWLGVRALFRKFYFREKPKKAVDENGEILFEQPIQDSKPLTKWRKFYFNVIEKIILWFVGLYNFVREREALWGGWLLLVLLYFNVFTIAVEFIAYYLYFSVTFDIVNLYRQIYKLFLDVYPFIVSLPVFSWIVLIILGLRKKSTDLEYENIARVAQEEGDV